MTPIQLVFFIILTLLPTACASKKESVIPSTLLTQIDWTVSFTEIKESPSTYKGSVIIAGGEVLSAKRLKDHTRLTVLQLPLSAEQEPRSDRTQSEGRFMAIQSEFLDPATIPAGTRVTVVGEVSGSTTELLDEMEYDYPTLAIKHLEIWPHSLHNPYLNRPYYGYPYYPYGGFGGFYRGGLGAFYGPYPYLYPNWY